MDVTSSMSGVGKLVQSVDGHPLLYTVEEAAGLLRIGRTLAYALARRYERSAGSDGLPVVRLGNCLRVPHWALLELACNGRVVSMSELDQGRRRDVSRPTPPNRRPTVVRIVDRTAKSVTRRPTSQPPKVGRVAQARRSSQPRRVEQLPLLPSE